MRASVPFVTALMYAFFDYLIFTPIDITIYLISFNALLLFLTSYIGIAMTDRMILPTMVGAFIGVFFGPVLFSYVFYGVGISTFIGLDIFGLLIVLFAPFLAYLILTALGVIESKNGKIRM